MNSSGIIAIIGAVALGFIVRVFNVVLVWLARVMKVKAPDPIDPPKQWIDPSNVTGIKRNPEAPE